jgi:hypothetical protein
MLQYSSLRNLDLIPVLMENEISPYKKKDLNGAITPNSKLFVIRYWAEN